MKFAVIVFINEEAYTIDSINSRNVFLRSTLEKYLDESVCGEPFFTDLYTQKRKYGQSYTYPVIGIWISDYYICHPEELHREES